MTHLFYRQIFPVPGFQIPGDGAPFIGAVGLGPIGNLMPGGENHVGGEGEPDSCARIFGQHSLIVFFGSHGVLRLLHVSMVSGHHTSQINPPFVRHFVGGLNRVHMFLVGDGVIGFAYQPEIRASVNCHFCLLVHNILLNCYWRRYCRSVGYNIYPIVGFVKHYFASQHIEITAILKIVENKLGEFSFIFEAKRKAGGCVDWLRFYTDILDDPKCAAMSDRTYRTWTLLLLHVRERGTPGVLDISVRDIGWRLRQPASAIQRAINELLRLEILTGDGTDNNPYLFKNWAKRQFESDNPAPRMQRYRQRNRQRNGDVTAAVTVTPPDTDTDTDTDTELRAIGLSLKGGVDNSEPEYPPFDSVTPEKEKTKKPPEEKRSPPGDENQELRDLIGRVKAKHPKLPIDSWYGKNIRAHPDAIKHVLRSLLKNGDDVEFPFTYLQKALEVENGKYNARDSEAEHEIRKKPNGNEFEMLGKIIGRAVTSATP